MVLECEKEWILEAINHLKHRKARPDLPHISLRMKRKHQMSFPQTKKLLDSLIECGFVVQAEYKNKISYRDVSKWKKGRLGGQIMNSSKMLKRFIKAIRENEASKGTGVSAQTIEEYLGSKVEQKCFLSGSALRDALDKEIETGFLYKRAVGDVTVYRINEDHVSKMLPALDLDSGDAQDSKDQECGVVAPTDGTCNKPNSSMHSKKLTPECLFSAMRGHVADGLEGASFDDIKTALSKQSIVETDTNVSLCLQDSISKGVVESQIVMGKTFYILKDNGEANRTNTGSSSDGLLSSHTEYKMECDRSDLEKRLDVVTSSLVQFQASMSRLSQNPSFAGRNTVGDKTNVVLPLRPPSKRKRVMKNHGPDFEIEMPTKVKSRFTENKESVFPTPADSPSSEKSEAAVENSFKFETKKKRGRPKKGCSPTPKTERVEQDSEIFNDENSKQGTQSEQSSLYNEDEEDSRSLPAYAYPDIASWTPQQVAEYFAQKGYEAEAQKMLENELDGAALALLKRSDIVGPPLGGMLGIKTLGVALKLFRDIRDLLYQGNADNYMDPYEEKPFHRS
ncbi:uncharacterized protein LOC101856808 isoform X1 [Aplysia californica]|uniref:Uncharacterized protein LOC101856808 isoform X1 n=1 Tax=Aplysia californica TaxID=6500 RepID=A0ABM0JRL3_APLCA|nr:uncharacterized protein LOC101856808 isoform X1 [Aplysia californica]